MGSGALLDVIYEAIAQVPRGRVVTYGQVAMLAGRVGGHRAVARALRMAPSESAIPWHRVLAKAGPKHARIAIPDPAGAGVQRARLLAEGVTFDARGRVSLLAHGWLPIDT